MLISENITNTDNINNKEHEWMILPQKNKYKYTTSKANKQGR
jgi:hypothetical protein